MHTFARRHHRSQDAGAATTGLVLNGGWRYDLTIGLMDAVVFRGQLRQLRARTIALAQLHPGQQVLDVGCGTGTLALEVARRVGHTGAVVGVDPSATQVARAQAKAARRSLPVTFQRGVIEQVPFPDDTFDVVLSSLMLHHLPDSLKRQGLAEIHRVLTPGGRLVIADFTTPQQRQGLARCFHAGGSHLGDLRALVASVGFEQLETEQLPARRFTGFPGAVVLRASKPAAWDANTAEPRSAP